jgi:hypothetical protein
MRNLLAFLAAAVLTFLGLGWYLGWYTFHTVPAGAGHHGYTIDIDAKKTENDVQQGVQKAAGEVKDLWKKAQTEQPAKPTDKKGPAPLRSAVTDLENLPRIIIGQEEEGTPQNP